MAERRCVWAREMTYFGLARLADTDRRTMIAELEWLVEKELQRHGASLKSLYPISDPSKLGEPEPANTR